MTDILHRLAAEAGIETHWQDAFGADHAVPNATIRAVLTALDLPSDNDSQCVGSIAILKAENRKMPVLVTAETSRPIEVPGAPGQYRILDPSGEIIEGTAEPAGPDRVRLAPIERPGDYTLEIGTHRSGLAVAPTRAFTIADAMARSGREKNARPWGLAVQAYAVRRRAGEAMGDFAALAELAMSAARQGADALAISPVHALFAAEPRHYSPYAPSTRLALNAVYVPEHAEGEARPEELIDWPSANQRRMAALRTAFERGGAEDGDFIAFAEGAPEAIRRHALFEAISAREVAQGKTVDWRNWPIALHDPFSDAVAPLARELDAEIRFHLYAQFRAETELAAAQEAARSAGMAIGLVADLAVGADPAGSDAWCQREAMLRGLSIGAPPDPLSREGQGWGLTAFSPRGLQHSGFLGFRAMLGAAMARAGGVRIDHAMGLRRLWVIPDGASSVEGCYLNYPFDDMLRLALLESYRNQAILIAEDLGTVPIGFREMLAARGVLGMSVMWFERDGERFVPPVHWRRATAAMTTSHDLPTAAGWWRGTDIAWRERLGLAGDSVEQRERDRALLWSACTESGAASGDMPAPEDNDAIANAVTGHLGSTDADLAILPIEDAMALTEQPNIPGTTDQHPNWRRLMPGLAGSMLDAPRTKNRLAILNARRGWNTNS